MSHNPLDLAALQLIEIRVNGKTITEVMITETELPMLKKAINAFCQALPQNDHRSNKALRLV